MKFYSLKPSVVLSTAFGTPFLFLFFLLLSSCSQKPAKVTVNSNFPNSIVYINGEEIGLTPQEVNVLPGEYTLKVQKKQFYFDTTFTAQEEESIPIDADIQQALLKVTSNVRGAEIYLDGNLLGIAPYSGLISPGLHKIQVIKNGFYNYEKDEVIANFQEQEHDVNLLARWITIGRNKYPVVRIGNQIWMGEDLREPISGSYCDYPCEQGRHYKWEVARRYAQSLSGWRLPTQQDWQGLISHLGGIRKAAPQLYQGGLTRFEALPTGLFNIGYNEYSEVGERAYYWSATEGKDKADAFGYEIDSRIVDKYPYDKELAFSVRYVRDWVVE